MCPAINGPSSPSKTLLRFYPLLELTKEFANRVIKGNLGKGTKSPNKNWSSSIIQLLCLIFSDLVNPFSSIQPLGGKRLSHLFHFSPLCVFLDGDGHLEMRFAPSNILLIKSKMLAAD